MRGEILKKLDELMAWVLTEPGTIPAEVSLSVRREAWQTLRDELAAERCDACRWWRGTTAPGHLVQRCAYIDTLMYPDADCSHFEPKVEERSVK